MTVVEHLVEIVLALCMRQITFPFRQCRPEDFMQPFKNLFCHDFATTFNHKN